MEKEDSEKGWKETLSSAAAKTALPLTSLLASGAYATQEALKGANQHVKNLEHTIKLKDVDISQLEGDVEGFKMACAELWTHNAGVCRQELEDILNLVRVELNAGVDLENSKRALINHEFEASKKFLANNTASRIAIGVAAVSAVACVGIMGKGIYDALQAASRDKKPAITQLQAAEYHDTLLASPLKQTQL